MGFYYQTHTKMLEKVPRKHLGNKYPQTPTPFQIIKHLLDFSDFILETL